MHSQGGLGGSSSMDHESHLAHHEPTFGGDQWGDMSPYMQTTMADYGGGAYAYMPPISHGHGLPSESLGRMPPPATPPQPPLHQQHQHQHQQHQQHQQHPHSQPPPHHHPTLPMLMVPSHPTWPSMLTNPGGFNSSPPVAIPPASAGIPSLKATRPPVPPIASQPRKTLTDEDRRRMCQYHIDNPSMKQTEIGALFGVERSTVSKVLSRKDKWLNPEDRSNSPIKKTKGKIPDIDKTLANWLRNEQHKGRRVSDAEIQEQARMYARPFREAETKINNPSWLEKFKQKHGMGGRLIRRASETNIPSAAPPKLSAAASPTLASSQPSSAISSASPVHQQSPSPFSTGGGGARGCGDEDNKEGAGGGSSSMMMDFNEPPSGRTGTPFKHHPMFNSETAGSSFSENTLSPTGTGQFTFSPDPNVGGFLSSSPDQARAFPPGGPNFQRPRSQTFPTLDLEYMNQQADAAAAAAVNTPITPQQQHPHQYPHQHHQHHQHHHLPSTGPPSALESPAHEFGAAGPFGGLDGTASHTMSPHHRGLHHSSSASSLQGGRGGSQQQQQQQQGGGGGGQGGGGGGGGSSSTPVIGSSALSSSVASSPVSPSQEDARRAADTLLSFIANSGPNSFVDQTDYNAVIRLTEKLRLHQQAQQAQAAAAAAAVRSQQQQPPGIGGGGGGSGGSGLGVMGPPVLGTGAAAGGLVGMGIGIGGLDRIPEGDAEMGNTGQHGGGDGQGGEMIKTEGPMAV